MAAYDAAVKGALGLGPADAVVGFLYLGTESERAPLVPAEWRDLVRDFADTSTASG